MQDLYLTINFDIQSLQKIIGVIIQDRKGGGL